MPAKNLKEFAKLPPKQKAMLIGSVLIALFAIGRLAVWLLGSDGGSRSLPRVEQVYFYELDSKKLIPASPDTIPPMDSGGGKAVRAFVFSCDGCKEDRTIGYVLLYTPAAYQARLAVNKQGGSPDGKTLKLIEAGELVGSPDAMSALSPLRSKAGHDLVMKARSRKCPDGKALEQCFP